MKINGTIFSKPQQDQLKRGIGTELDKVVAKVDDAWYLDPVDDSNEFSFLGTPINAPLVLYAHWV